MEETNISINNNNICYICMDSDNHNDVIYACRCKGTNNGIHQKCLLKWIQISKKNKCTVCNYVYKYEFIYNPSCKKFKENMYHNFFTLNDIIITNNGNILIIFVIFIFLQIILLPILIFVFNIIKFYYIICIYFATRLLLVLTTKKIDKNFDFINAFKYSELSSSIMIYIFFTIKEVVNYDKCLLYCNINGNQCNKDCYYYEEYNIISSEYNTAIILQTIIISLVFVLDTSIKIKKSLFIKVIKQFINDTE